jgi:hypothetical protein
LARLQEKNNKGPRAFSAKRISCVKREDEDVANFLDAVSSTIMDTTDEKILELIGNHLAWECICEHIALATPHNCDALLYFLTQLSRYRGSLGQHVDDFYRFMLSTRFFNADDGHFAKLLKRLNHDEEESLLNKTKQLILQLLDAVPEKAKNTLKFVKHLLRNDGRMESFVVSVLEKSMAGKAANGTINELDWSELPLVPSNRDLLSCSLGDSRRLMPVRTHGPYASVDEYMDTYCRLLWVDGFSSMQKGVQQLLAGNLDHRDMHVYHSVSLISLCLPHQDDDVMLLLHVNHHNDRINWETTSALMYGNLLCLSPTGNFKDAIYATVAERDIKELKKKGFVKVHLLNECNTQSPADTILALLTNNGHIVMIESPTYYRAYQPVIRALQAFRENDVPFQEELVSCTVPQDCRSPYHESSLLSLQSSRINHIHVDHESGSFRPAHEETLVNESLSLNRTKATTLNEMELSFETAVDSTLSSWHISPDPSQREAVIHALKQRVACIQGPPGTGKTFAGILIARILLEQRLDAKNIQPTRPILVLTYKNHALDEFLKQLLNYFPGKIARVGGRCNDPELEKCNLSELKRRMPRDWEKIQEIIEKTRLVKAEMQKVLRDLRSKIVFTPQSYAQFMPPKNCRKLIEGHLWLKIRRKIKLTDQENAVLHQLKVEDCADGHVTSSAIFNEAFNYWLPNVDLATTIDQSFAPRLPHSNSFARSNFTANASGVNSAEDRDEDSEEDDEREEERKFADDRASTGAANYIPIDWSSDELKRHRLLQSAEKLMSDKPISLYSALDPHQLEPIQRLVLIQWMLLQQTEAPRQALSQLLSEYQRLCRRRRELEAQHAIGTLRQMAVVGMTITGASLYREIVAGLRCDVTLVEEAAEILEPQLVATLGRWTKHLILIGDHQQLRPPVESYKLVKEYNFDISLMERLINNGLPHRTLNMQNRMREEFASLLLDIYPNIRSNLDRVSNNVAPLCMKDSMFFWDHVNEETKARSVTNGEEGEMAVQLALFLIQYGGYLPSQITILAAYQGQTGLIRKLTREAQVNYPELFPDFPSSVANASSTSNGPPAAQPNKPIKMRLQVQTVDMFQGDENDVVIVSLVRCNKQQSIGFLKQLNRRCVAQSRAKSGMYLIGSVDTISISSHWRRMIGKMAEAGCVGRSITMRCPRHVDVSVSASSSKDIPRDPFCLAKCLTPMNCGLHSCNLPCQPFHNHDKCLTEYKVRLSRCGHVATKKCYEKEEDVHCLEPCHTIMQCGLHRCLNPCNPQHEHFFCEAEVKFTFSSCEHTGSRKCAQQETDIRCKKFVSFTFQTCGHAGSKRCNEDASKIICMSRCIRKTKCGHICTNPCGKECTSSDKCETCAEIRRIEEEKRRQEEERLLEARRKEIQREIDAFRQKPLNAEVEVTELLPTGQDKVHIYNKLKDMVNLYVKPDHNWKPEVKKIEEITNSDLELKWLESKLSMFDPSHHHDLKFHGTSREAAEKIVRHGFRLPEKSTRNRPMYGCGVYFATDSSKSAQNLYTRGSNMLLICDVLLGKPYVAERAMQYMDEEFLNERKRDSLYAKRDTRDKGGVKYDEFVVYNPARALPRYIVHYECVDQNVANDLLGEQPDAQAVDERKDKDN